MFHFFFFHDLFLDFLDSKQERRSGCLWIALLNFTVFQNTKKNFTKRVFFLKYHIFLEVPLQIGSQVLDIYFNPLCFSQLSPIKRNEAKWSLKVKPAVSQLSRLFCWIESDAKKLWEGKRSGVFDRWVAPCSAVQLLREAALSWTSSSRTHNKTAAAELWCFD